MSEAVIPINRRVNALSDEIIDQRQALNRIQLLSTCDDWNLIPHTQMVFLMNAIKHETSDALGKIHRR